MQHDPVRVAEVRTWLLKAAEDLRAAEHGFTASPPLLAPFVFHCQQAAEKVLKGFLVWHDIPFRKTHDLGEIASRQSPSIRLWSQRVDASTLDGVCVGFPLSR
jgi:HEPN domain-containing protein